jgi:hypothetical protein
LHSFVGFVLTAACSSAVLRRFDLHERADCGFERRAGDCAPVAEPLHFHVARGPFFIVLIIIIITTPTITATTIVSKHLY